MAHRLTLGPQQLLAPLLYFHPPVLLPERQHAKINTHQILICSYTLKLVIFSQEKFFFPKTKFEWTLSFDNICHTVFKFIMNVKGK